MSAYFLLPPVLFIALNFSSIVSFVKNFQNNLPLYHELYKNLSTVAMADFVHFRLRRIASEHLETGLLKVKHKTYELTYYNDSIKYIIVFPKKRGPCPFFDVFTMTPQGEINVTEQIRKYAGPSHDFHCVKTTPEMIGYDNLTFSLRDSRIMSFIGDQVISFVSEG